MKWLFLNKNLELDSIYFQISLPSLEIWEKIEDQCKIFVQLCLLLRLFIIEVPCSSSSIIVVLFFVACRRRGECERSSPTAKLRGSVNTDKSVPTDDNQQVPAKGEPSEGSSAPLSLPSQPLLFHKLTMKRTNCFNVKEWKVDVLELYNVDWPLPHSPNLDRHLICCKHYNFNFRLK